MRIEPKLTEGRKNKRKKFVNWVGHNFTQRADEKIFDLDGMYNSQNQRIWASSRDEADEKGGIKEKQKFPQKVMLWLGVCSKGVTPLVIFDRETVDHIAYISRKSFQLHLSTEIRLLENIEHFNRTVRTLISVT